MLQKNCSLNWVNCSVTILRSSFNQEVLVTFYQYLGSVSYVSWQEIWQVYLVAHIQGD
jgi:hypothetical protein